MSRRGRGRRGRRGRWDRRFWSRASGLALVILVAVYALWGPAISEQLGLAGDPNPPAKGEALRLVSWNLRNFPGPEQDLELLRARLQALDADVIAVQEIRDPDALAALLPGWERVLSERGGRGHQRLGVLYDPARVELLGEPVEHHSLSLEGRVRPALSVYLRARDRGPDFHLVVVHLKAMTRGYPQRQEQWGELAAVVEGLGIEGPGAGDRDLIVAGDFNTTGPAQGATEAELRALGEALAGAGLRRLGSAGGCSAYWDGPRRDAWQEPSLLDHIWVRDLAESLGGHAQVRAMGHCARHRCEAFRSTAAYPDLDFARLSDHCPLVIDLALADDDP